MQRLHTPDLISQKLTADLAVPGEIDTITIKTKSLVFKSTETDDTGKITDVESSVDGLTLAALSESFTPDSIRSLAQHPSAQAGSSDPFVNSDQVQTLINTHGKNSVSQMIPFKVDTLDELSGLSATEYHGHVVHVHGEGAMYFAHASNWIKILDENYVPVTTALPTGESSGDILKVDENGTLAWGHAGGTKLADFIGFSTSTNKNQSDLWDKYDTDLFPDAQSDHLTLFIDTNFSPPKITISNNSLRAGVTFTITLPDPIPVADYSSADMPYELKINGQDAGDMIQTFLLGSLSNSEVFTRWVIRTNSNFPTDSTVTVHHKSENYQEANLFFYEPPNMIEYILALREKVLTGFSGNYSDLVDAPTSLPIGQSSGDILKVDEQGNLAWVPPSAGITLNQVQEVTNLSNYWNKDNTWDRLQTDGRATAKALDLIATMFQEPIDNINLGYEYVTLPKIMTAAEVVAQVAAVNSGGNIDLSGYTTEAQAGSIATQNAFQLVKSIFQNDHLISIDTIPKTMTVSEIENEILMSKQNPTEFSQHMFTHDITFLTSLARQNLAHHGYKLTKGLGDVSGFSNSPSLLSALTSKIIFPRTPVDMSAPYNSAMTAWQNALAAYLIDPEIPQPSRSEQSFILAGNPIPQLIDYTGDKLSVTSVLPLPMKNDIGIYPQDKTKLIMGIKFNGIINGSTNLVIDLFSRSGGNKMTISVVRDGGVYIKKLRTSENSYQFGLSASQYELMRTNGGMQYLYVQWKLGEYAKLTVDRVHVGMDNEGFTTGALPYISRLPDPTEGEVITVHSHDAPAGSTVDVQELFSDVTTHADMMDFILSEEKECRVYYGNNMGSQIPSYDVGIDGLIFAAV
jgi:hypothetical protein